MKPAVARLSVYLLLLVGILFHSCSIQTQEQSAADIRKEPAQPLFTLITSKHSGILFKNKLPENRHLNILTYQYYYNGGGVAIGDINNDQLPDLFFTGNIAPNRLYLNRGNFQFEDITETAGIRNPSNTSWCTGVNMVDINDDGWLDIYVCRSGNLQPGNRSNLLYINNGDNTFIESAPLYNLNDQGYSIQSAFFDYDRDGDLDMFLTNHGLNYYGRDQSRSQQNDLNYYAGERLYRNDNGYFHDVSKEAGILARSYSFGLGLGIGDLNNDGWDDVYVSNDFYEHDYMYLNQGDGTFKESIKDATAQISYFGMGNDLGDINNDGLLDILVVDMPARDHHRRLTNLAGLSYDKFNEFVEKGFHQQYMFNSLNLNNGNGTFSNIAQLLGIANTDWSWAPLMVDLDNNGHKDIFISNGLRKDALNLDFINSINTSSAKNLNPEEQVTDQQFMEILSSMPSERLSNYIFANYGNFRVEERMQQWGLNHQSFSNGAAYGDLDNDGDLDLVVNNLDDLPFVYKNNSEKFTQHNYLRIKLMGPAGNQLGLGSKITLRAGNLEIFQQHFLSRGYQSSMDPVLTIGVGEQSQVDQLVVKWNDGKETIINDIPVNQELVVEYSEATRPAEQSNHSGDDLFEDVTRKSKLDFVHRENDFDDFRFEILLPYRQSTLGPALASGDVNGDNLDDFFIGAASGDTGALFLQNTDGTFRRSGTSPWSDHNAFEDVNAHFFDADGDSDLDLYVVSGGAEFSENDPHYQDRLYINQGNGNFINAGKDVIPEMHVSGGVAVSADYDLDGDLDLFVGGRLVPGRYGTPAPSFLLINETGNFKQEELTLPDHTGMVTDALWQDFDGDGRPDLVITGEWMPVVLLKNNGTAFTDVTTSYGLGDTNGWYQSLDQGDFNQDGKLDLVAGNIGLNYRYKATAEQPFELVAGDFDQNQDYDAILAYHQDGNLYPFELRDKLFDQMRFIKRKYPLHENYSRATVEEIVGKDQFDQALRLKAKEFASLMLLREDNGFKSVPLPVEAQMSATMDVVSADFNKDGLPDLILGGNLYQTEHQTSRLDAGTGVYLENAGDGEFTPYRGPKKGIWMPGDVRKIRLLRSAEGLMVLVAKNLGSLQLFRISNTSS